MTTWPSDTDLIDSVAVQGHAPEIQSPAIGRIEGIDLARALAMAGMLITHFVLGFLAEDTLLGTAALVFDGRAMPLFVLLGGVGVTLMTARSATPDRALLVRAAILMAVGLAFTEWVDFIFIVLQAYSLFFILAVGLRRLPTPVLPALASAMVAIGAFTYQTVGEAPALTRYNQLFTSTEGVESLVFDGAYPLFPVGAFFVVGMWLGRLDLRSGRVASAMAVGGTVVGVGTVAAADALARALDAERTLGYGWTTGVFAWSELLGVKGHSEMPAWVISATATSIAVLGFSLLAATRRPRLVAPLVAVGTTALTFYLIQAALTTRIEDSYFELPLARQWLAAAGIYVGYMIVAVAWRRWFGAGPAERLLRIGTGGKRPAPVGLGSGPQ